MYNNNKTFSYYIELLAEDIFIYISGLTHKEVPYPLLALFAVAYLIVPLSKIERSDSISGLLYGCFGMLSGAVVFFLPTDYLSEKANFGKLLLGMTLFSIPPLYRWFRRYGEVLVVEKQEKQIDYELIHANDAFEEAMNEGK